MYDLKGRSIHLVHHQIGHSPLIFRIDAFLAPPVCDKFCCREVEEEVESVHNGDQGIQLSNLLQAA